MRWRFNGVAAAGIAVLMGMGMWSCDRRTPAQANDSKPGPSSSVQLPAQNAAPSRPEAAAADKTASLQDRIAGGLATACPSADGSDIRARDAAADTLGNLSVLLDACDAHIMWGEFDATKGTDPDNYKLIQLPPLAWAKLYLSTFMIGDKHEVRKDGDFTVLEIDAKFRDKLEPGEYPHAFWHTAEEWRGYRDTTSLLLVFSDDRLVMALHKSADGKPQGDAPKWDGRWRWLDARGVEQPRVAQYGYLFSKDNPHLKDLDAAYKRLESAGMVNNCAKCHGPDRAGKSDPLVLLIYPNQAIAARHSLAAVLREETMPPGDIAKGIESGIANETLRQELIRLADEFEKQAEAALKHEADARKKTDETGSK